MVKVECSKCGKIFEAKTEEKAKKKLMKHAKKYHSK
jgi:hypothetical protein